MGGAMVQSRLRLTCTPIVADSRRPLSYNDSLSQPSVVAISLIDNGLDGDLASLFVLFSLGSTLQAVELPSNALHGSLVLPAAAMASAGAPNTSTSLLRYLALDNNLFVGPLPSWLAGLVNMQHLSLSSNALTGTVSPDPA